MRSNNFYKIIVLFFKLLLVKHGEKSLLKNRPQLSDLFCNVIEGPVYVYNQWQIMKIQQVATLR